MSDPAVEAARSAWEDRYPGGSVDLAASAYEDGIGALVINVARAALKPIRELHRPTSDGIGLTICAECSRRVTSTMWPCRTARLVYSGEELAK